MAPSLKRACFGGQSGKFLSGRGGESGPSKVKPIRADRGGQRSTRARVGVTRNHSTSSNGGRFDPCACGGDEEIRQNFDEFERSTRARVGVTQLPPMVEHRWFRARVLVAANVDIIAI